MGQCLAFKIDLYLILTHIFECNLCNLILLCFDLYLVSKLKYLYFWIIYQLSFGVYKVLLISNNFHMFFLSLFLVRPVVLDKDSLYISVCFKNVSTKIRKSFLSLLDLNFPRNHIYNSIFNRNKIKVSYSCIKNMKSILNNHNMKVLKNTTEIEESCDCRDKNNCPLDGRCLTPNINYKAQIMLDQLNYKQKIYIGTAKTDFKHRFNNHTNLFNLEHYENETELSKEYWTIKRNHFTSKVTWIT